MKKTKEALVEAKPAPIAYDPRKQYRWEPTDKFYLTGEQFAIILNGLRRVIMTEEAQSFLFAAKANDVIEDLMAENVKNGVIKEKETPPSN